MNSFIWNKSESLCNIGSALRQNGGITTSCFLKVFAKYSFSFNAGDVVFSLSSTCYIKGTVLLPHLPTNTSSMLSFHTISLHRRITHVSGLTTNTITCICLNGREIPPLLCKDCGRWLDWEDVSSFITSPHFLWWVSVIPYIGSFP